MKLPVLRYYLPHLLRFYWDGLIGPELETALLLYREQLSAGEIALVTEVAVHRARATYWAWDAVFPLFWCDDPETLAEAFQKTDELWVALRSYVRRSSDPLWYLWDGRYNLPPGVDLYGPLVERKGQRILLFLRKVGWIV